MDGAAISRPHKTSAFAKTAGRKLMIANALNTTARNVKNWIAAKK